MKQKEIEIAIYSQITGVFLQCREAATYFSVDE